MRSVPWQTWAKQDNVTIQPGSVIDESKIIGFAMELTERYQVLQWGVDQWNGRNFEQVLTRHGQSVTLINPTATQVNEPILKIESMVTSRRFKHPADPVLSWMLPHVVVDVDAKGHKRFDKASAADKIDGFSALSYGVAVWIKGQQTASKYETEGLFEI